MPETPQHPDEKVSVATERRIRWDALAAIVASLVGLLALLVGGYTAYIQRQQVQAQVWPYLQMGASNGSGHFEFVAINRGVGPAIVQSVQVLANGKPVHDWHALFKLLDFTPTGRALTGTLSQTVLAPGDQVSWITFQNTQDINAFVSDWARFHVETRVCYSSTLGESWFTVYRPGWPGSYRPRPVSSCPDLPESVQFSD